MEPKILRLTEPKGAGAPPLLRNELYRADAHDFNLIQVDANVTKDPHPYDHGDSFMIIVAGSMKLQVDGTFYPLSAGQMAIIPKGAMRGFVAGPEGLTFFAAHLRG